MARFRPANARRSIARREVGTLSAAGKQVVSMARALSHDARLIVMDEPSAVLDSATLLRSTARCRGKASSCLTRRTMRAMRSVSQTLARISPSTYSSWLSTMPCRL